MGRPVFGQWFRAEGMFRQRKGAPVVKARPGEHAGEEAAEYGIARRQPVFDILQLQAETTGAVQFVCLGTSSHTAAR